VVLKRNCKIGTYSVIMPAVTPVKQKRKRFHGAGGGGERHGGAIQFCQEGCA